ncbi:MAG: hypothetical protein JWN57_795 [Frankiales bacterium]|nr:hypothetical protein [Frankiales bacterium]
MRGQQVRTAAAYALVLVLSLLCAVWGAFLVPLRVFGVLLPVSLVLAAVGNYLLGRAGARLHGRLGAALPGVLWFLVAAQLQSRRPEGDLVVVGNLVGLLFLLVGTVAAAVPVGLAPRTSPGR